MKGRRRLLRILLITVAFTVSVCAWLSVHAQSILVGYMVQTADTNNRVPVGTALFTYSNAQGILVCQAGVPATEPIRSGRIFVDEAGTKTGVVFVNSTSTAASVTLVLRDSGGTEVSRQTITLGANSHLSRYVVELFPSRPANLNGSLTFDSDQPLAALTLRESANAQGEPLYATFPVANLTAPATTTAVTFPHLAAGDGFTTQLVLINPTSQIIRGRVRLYASNGTPLALRLAGSSVSDFTYQIAANGTYRPELDSVSGLGVGYAIVTPDAGNTTPAGTVIFRYSTNGQLVTEAGVAATNSTTSARIFVDNNQTLTGVAIANPGTQSADITLTLMGRTGLTEATTTRTLAAGNHMAIFAHELFTLYDGFSGEMEISSSVPIVPLTLKVTTNARNQTVITTLPVADLTRPPTAARVFFPQIAIGSGFSTRLIFINSDRTIASNGRMNFYQTTGANLNVPMGGSTSNQFAYGIVGGGGRQFYPGNTFSVSRIALIDPTSNIETSELVINEGYTVRPRLRVLDASGAIRDDYDVTMSSLSQDVATVNNTLGSVEGKKMGFSTLTLSSGGRVMTATTNVVGVNSGVTGYWTGVVQDQAQQLYLASTEDHTIRFAPSLKQSADLYAGVSLTPGLRNDARLNSLFKGPTYLAYDNYEGSLYVADSSNHVIRRVRPGTSGRVETFAGSGGVPGSTDGPVAQALFYNPQGLAFDKKGNLWVVDSSNHTIRRINMVTLRVDLIAGQPGSPGTADGNGNNARFNAPQGIAIEAETDAQRTARVQRGEPAPPDSFIIADTGNGLIRRVRENGQVETLGTVGAGIAGFPSDSKKRTGQPATAIVSPFRFNAPAGVVVDPTGTIFVTEPGSGQVRAVLGNGSVVSAAQTDTFERPRGLTLTPGGRILVADSKRPIRELQYGGPEITSISPIRVVNRGGERITIRGKNFAPDTVVVIGGVVLSGAAASNTESITFTAPPLPSGLTTLSVRTRAGLAQKPILIDAVPVTEIAAGVITTAAGGSTFAGDGALATLAQVGYPNAVAVEIGGNLYIADTDNHRIRKVDTTSGIITTIAGTGRPGYTGENVLAIASALSSPSGVAIDAAGSIYIADSDNNRIRKVLATTGLMSTIAGTGTADFSGDNGLAAAATLDTPKGVAVDSTGNVFIADTGNNRIRRIDGRTGVMTTVAGNGQHAYSGDGSRATSAALADPGAVAVDAAGNIFIADTYNDRVRKVTAATGVISTVAGNGNYTFGGDGGLATSASLSDPGGVAIDQRGNLYIADSTNSRIRKVDASTQRISTIAGTGQRAFSGDRGPAASATLFRPGGVAVDAAGVVWIADTFNQRVRRIAPSTQIIVTAAGDGRTRFGGDGGAANAATISSPGGVAIDAAGNIFLADSGNNRIRKISAGNSVITTVAGNGQIRVSGVRSDSSFAGDGGPATDASLRFPFGVAVSRTNELYIADTGNQRIRKVDTRGVITTIAGNGDRGFSGDGGRATSASLRNPSMLAVDAAGNVFVADTDNNRVRRIAAATGVITTFAGNGTAGFSGDGGPATSARLDTPVGLALDANGNLYIADLGNFRVRRVNAGNGNIVTVAGNGDAGFSGDNGRATSASIGPPFGIAVDANSNLYIADTFNGRIRMVAAATGIITTVAGSGRYEFSGDNAQAITAGLADPLSIAVDPRGNLYISDTTNDRLRAVRSPSAPANVPRTCAALSYGQSVTGTLSASSGFSRNDPTARANCYTFTGNAGDRITIAMNASAFDTYLYLNNSVGQVIASDDDGGGGTNSRIPPSGTFTLPTTGVYTIEASAYDSNATGSYTLAFGNVTLPTTRTCSAISYNQTISGNLNSSDLPSRNRAGNSDCYTFNGNAGDRIYMTLNSTAFDAYLYFMNSAGTLIDEDDDSGGNSNSRIPETGLLTLPASGTYTIEVTSYSSGETGSYVLGLTRQGTAIVASCQSISFGQTINGALSATDSRSRVRTSSYADCYTFSGTAGDRFVITMNSTSLDPFLIMINAAGQVVVSDDDSGGGLNARIPPSGSYTLPATGTYTIEATTYDSDQVGTYTLALTRTSSGTPVTTCTPIAYGQSQPGQLATTDARSAVRTGAFAHCYQFSGTAGDKIVITMTSTAFDTYLVLMNASRRSLIEDDDGGGGTNSRIPPTGTFTLPATGTYYIEATSYDADTTGVYIVSLARTTDNNAGGPSCPAIAFNQTVNGALTTNSILDDVGSYVNCYTFSAAAGDRIAILLTSNDFDTILDLIDPSGALLAFDDDSGGGTNSRIPASGFLALPVAGVYKIAVTSYETAKTGAYTLQLIR